MALKIQIWSICTRSGQEIQSRKTQLKSPRFEAGLSSFPLCPTSVSLSLRERSGLLLCFSRYRWVWCYPSWVVVFFPFSPRSGTALPPFAASSGTGFEVCAFGTDCPSCLRSRDLGTFRLLSLTSTQGKKSIHKCCNCPS